MQCSLDQCQVSVDAHQSMRVTSVFESTAVCCVIELGYLGAVHVCVRRKQRWLLQCANATWHNTTSQ